MLKTRFAPSPTGNLQLGGARTALINYIVSKKSASSKFYLRIEDTDHERSKQEYTDNITNSLKWLGLNWDEEIQVQSERLSRHQEIARELLQKKQAFKCVCSEEKIANQRKLIKENKNYSKKICTECKNDNDIQSRDEGFVVRLDVPDEGNLKIKDTIQGDVTVANLELDDFILLRKDQSPTYMLSVVVDDHDLGVNYIIRGDDHFINTFRQYYIYKFMNWDIPQYAHIPLIHGEDGTKLSGGQKQRVAIARAFLKNAPFLLLDEATSSLDSKSESRINKSLDSLMNNRTTLVIAHRLSTIINADRIVILHNGRVADIGTHKNLLKKSVIYKDLYELQFKNKNAKKNTST